jgi:hypothetical protein
LAKSKPITRAGLAIDAIEKEFVKALNQPSKSEISRQKNLNMWVDQEFDWIYNEIWMKGK